MMKCINAFARDVQVGQRESQKQRARKKDTGPPPLTKAQFRNIVNQIASGEIVLPDVQDLNDNDRITTWASLMPVLLSTLWTSRSTCPRRKFASPLRSAAASST